MQAVWLLVPDFSLILLGWILARTRLFDHSVWYGTEKLVYYVLFPALLFYSAARAELGLGATARMVACASAAVAAGMTLGALAKYVFRPPAVLFASGVQTAFRFNSYIGLAVAGRIGGEQGIALMAIIIGCLVPVCNLGAVWALARHAQTGVWSGVIRNPLISATLLGLIWNLSGLPLAEPLSLSLSRLGAAAIALGLMTVGASLEWSHAGRSKALVTYWMVVKLLAMPATAWLLSQYWALPLLQQQIVVLFAALPTASSAYILAVRMGGDGKFVAVLISVMTLCAVFSMPLWIAVVT